MGIATCRQNHRVLHDISAWTRADVFTPQRAHQRLDLVIGIKLFSNPRKQPENGNRFFALDPGPRIQPKDRCLGASFTKLPNCVRNN